MVRCGYFCFFFFFLVPFGPGPKKVVSSSFALRTEKNTKHNIFMASPSQLMTCSASQCPTHKLGVTIRGTLYRRVHQLWYAKNGYQPKQPNTKNLADSLRRSQPKFYLTSKTWMIEPLTPMWAKMATTSCVCRNTHAILTTPRNKLPSPTTCFGKAHLNRNGWLHLASYI